MELSKIAEIILSDPLLKNSTFKYSKFYPTSLFKNVNSLEVSYSTVHNFDECKLKFFIKKFCNFGFFKTGEALFLGNTVHKFSENVIKEYMQNRNINLFNDIILKNFNYMKHLFDKCNYINENNMVEELFKVIMDRKKFEPDFFFDDFQYISSIYRKKSNYVDKNLELFRNTAKLLKHLLSILDKLNVEKIFSEDWFKFQLDGIPVTFLGKIDLYFHYDNNGNKNTCIIDFKTGKKEYFSWDQLNYYALYFGEHNFENINKYFYDLKNKDVISYNSSVNNIAKYNEIYNDLRNKCMNIYECSKIFNEYIQKMKTFYTTKYEDILHNAKDELYKIPSELSMLVIDTIYNVFLKKSNIESPHSMGGFVCKFCDYLNFCTVNS